MRNRSPSHDRSREREQMIEQQLRQRGIRSEAVLSVMRSIPRERFVPTSAAADAYADAALAVECGQTISQPYMVARMTELLELHPTDRVLEIGTGTGYQTAILARLSAEVFTIEWYLPLMAAAAERFRELGLRNIRQRCADGSLGWPSEAPFDAILVTAGAPDVPKPLQEQLAEEGRLVVPVGPVGEQMLVRVRRRSGQFDREDVLYCRFVKLLGAAGWEE